MTTASIRSQEQNRERAIEMLKGKLFKKRSEDQALEKAGMSVSKTTEIEWGSQIRSYILHPYKQIKDHRTGLEVHDIESVLEGGNLDAFIGSLIDNTNSYGINPNCLIKYQVNRFRLTDTYGIK